MKRTVHAAIFDRGELERLRARVGRLFVALQDSAFESDVTPHVVGRITAT